jgi:PTS system nitrogen regulatory IIA component
MYLNIIQVAESFGVSEKVVTSWVRDEGLPHTPDRGRLLFDRARVAQWAASRGLTARVGFLAPNAAVFSSGFRLDDLLRIGGIWRDVPPLTLPSVIAEAVSRVPGTTPAIRQLLVERLRAPGGITMAPVGGGFALPHPSARIALGRESGLVALACLRDPLPLAEPTPDGQPVRWLFFFIAPSARVHLDLLAWLSRALVRGPLREAVLRGASDADILAAAAQAHDGAKSQAEGEP